MDRGGKTGARRQRRAPRGRADFLTTKAPTRAGTQPAQDDPILAAVLKLKDQSLRQVNWPAVSTFMVISMVAMIGTVLVPSTADAGVRWAAAMGLVIGAMASGVAVLYRHAPSFWVVRKPRERTASPPPRRVPQSPKRDG